MLDRGAIDAGARLCAGARAAAVPVVHCLAHFREDRAGSVANCRMLAASAKMSAETGGLLIGSESAQVIQEFDLQPSDIEIARWHGMSPFIGTSLDQTLRNLGVTTVVAAGVSLNVGVMGLVINAVDLGYPGGAGRRCRGWDSRRLRRRGDAQHHGLPHHHGHRGRHRGPMVVTNSREADKGSGAADNPAANKAVVERLVRDIVNGGQVDLLDEVLADDFVAHGVGSGPAGAEGMRRLIEAWRTAFPDWQDHIDEIVAEGDLVVIKIFRPGHPHRPPVGHRPHRRGGAMGHDRDDPPGRRQDHRAVGLLRLLRGGASPSPGGSIPIRPAIQPGSLTMADTSPVPDYAGLMRLDDKGFIVLGAGQGMGRQSSHALAQMGAKVFCVDLEAERAEQVAAEVDGIAWTADITKRDDVQGLVDEAGRAMGSIEGIVDIVGVSGWSGVLDIDDAEWDWQFDMVLRHAYLISQIAGRAMKETGGGTMVFIASVSGLTAAPNHAHYGAAKAGLMAWMQSVAIELAPYGIRANWRGAGHDSDAPYGGAVRRRAKGDQ